jgi:tetratricopeptide (TPR) repeat protein
VLLALVGGLAEQQPVLVVVEDLHWVDPSTLELLGLLIDQVPTTRLYTVLTCRPEFQAPWGFRTHLTPIALNRLTPSQAEAMVEEVLGAVRHLPESHNTLTQAIDLRLALHNALWPLGELGEVVVNLQDAQALAEALGEPHQLGWVATYLLAHFVAVYEPDHALAFGQRALAIAADLREVGITVTAQGWLGSLYCSLGDYRRAVECCQKNVACLPGELLHERFGLLGLASVFSRHHLAASLVECDAFAEGRACAEEGVQLAEAANHPYSRAIWSGWSRPVPRCPRPSRCTAPWR